jgi:hypothetical protein
LTEIPTDLRIDGMPNTTRHEIGSLAETLKNAIAATADIANTNPHTKPPSPTP